MWGCSMSRISDSLQCVMEFILEAVSIYYVVTISNSSLTLSGNANADMSIFPQHRALVSVGGG